MRQDRSEGELRKTQADAYFSLARSAILLFARSASDLRLWWSDESVHRSKYDLSEEQVQELIALCKQRVEELGPDEEPEEKPQPRRQAPKRKKAAI